MPSPGAMPRQQFEASTAAVEVDTERVTAELGEEVGQLLAEVDEVRQAAGDSFSLASLARQTALLEQAHDALTTALDAVDRH